MDDGGIQFGFGEGHRRVGHASFYALRRPRGYPPLARSAMKKLRLVPRLDPRLAAELRPQKRLIVRGLVMSVCVSLLNTAPIPLLGHSVNAINDAAPLAVSQLASRKQRQKELEEGLKRAGPALGLDDARAVRVADAVFARVDDARAAPLAREVARELGRPPEAVAEALATGGHRPTGSLEPLGRLALYCGLVLLCFGLKYVFVRASAILLSQAAAGLANGLRLRLFAKLQRLPISYFADKRAGAIQSVLTSDVGVYTGAIGVLKDSIESPLTILVALGYVLFNAPLLAGVGLLFVLPMSTVIRRNGRRIKASQGDVQNALSDLSAVTAETLQGTRVVKAFAAEGKIVADYSGRLDATYASQVENARVAASLRPLVELLGAAAVASVLFLCGWLSYLGRLDLGTITAVIFAFDRINQGLRSFTGITSTLNSIDAATERIHREILDVPDQVQDADAGIVLSHPTGRVEFQGVSFAYPDGTEALREVSFTLEPGGSLALVGPSGAGKSTVADLLLRFYDPTAGRVLFDGVDVRDLNLAWYRAQIGVVPQQTFLFAGSVAENVRLGKPDASDAEIAAAGRMAHAEEFVAALPGGYATHLGEGGAGLSGGQRQRVAIARALVREPALLLLDEATSALDAESERAVTEALDEVMRTRTTLFIAHRLTTAARADRILVMARGEAVECGAHAELLARGGAYAGLFKAFSGGVL